MTPRIGSVVAVALCLTACGGIFSDEPFVDARRDEQGDIVLLDTPRMWADWVYLIDMYVTQERRGVRPPGGLPSWNQFWLDMVRVNRRSLENPDRYIGYIIERRTDAGLPEIQGYP